jgi:hypothetical protein
VVNAKANQQLKFIVVVKRNAQKGPTQCPEGANLKPTNPSSLYNEFVKLVKLVKRNAPKGGQAQNVVVVKRNVPKGPT